MKLMQTEKAAAVNRTENRTNTHVRPNIVMISNSQIKKTDTKYIIEKIQSRVK